LKKIKEKDFYTMELLNSFVQNNDVTIISIESKTITIDSGFLLPNGGTFKHDQEVKRLYYQEN